MKITIIYIFSLFLLTLTSGRALCQQQEVQPSVVISKLSQELQISETKAAQLNEAMQVNRTAIESLLKEKSTDAAERQRTLQTLLAQRAAAISTVLTPEELQRLRAMMDAHVGEQRQQFREGLKEKNKQSLSAGSAPNP